MTTAKKPALTAMWTPRIVKPGPEVKALSRFLRNGTWTGTVEAGGMGPGSPEMDAKGRAVCKWIVDDLWISCQFSQDQYLKGKKVLTWKACFLAGWDCTAQEYRAVGVDSNGAAFIFHGELKDDQLVLESMGESPVKLRFTWDATDPDTMTWKNEMSIGSGPWRLIEEYILHPT